MVHGWVITSTRSLLLSILLYIIKRIFRDILVNCIPPLSYIPSNLGLDPKLCKHVELTQRQCQGSLYKIGGKVVAVHMCMSLNIFVHALNKYIIFLGIVLVASVFNALLRILCS